LLQEAKPLIKEITAPMLSLMLRKQLAELAGFTQQELDAEFQIKPQAAAAPAYRRPPPSQRSIVQTVIELLVLDASFGSRVDRALLAPGFGTPGVDQHELRALDRLLEELSKTPHIDVAAAAGEAEDGNQPAIRQLNAGEFFRDTEYGELFTAVEAGMLRWQERGLSGQDFEAEFTGAWRQLLVLIRKARHKVLLGKPQQEWSAAERAEFLVLEQQLKAVVAR
jgi:DNA primase